MTSEKVNTVELDGTSQKVEFEKLCVKQFLVKNFSGADVYVSLLPINDESKAIKLPKNTAQVICANLALCARDNEGQSEIYVKGASGSVEVQAIWY